MVDREFGGLDPGRAKRWVTNDAAVERGFAVENEIDRVWIPPPISQGAPQIVVTGSGDQLLELATQLVVVDEEEPDPVRRWD